MAGDLLRYVPKDRNFYYNLYIVTRRTRGYYLSVRGRTPDGKRPQEFKVKRTSTTVLFQTSYVSLPTGSNEGLGIKVRHLRRQGGRIVTVLLLTKKPSLRNQTDALGIKTQLERTNLEGSARK